MHCKDTILRPQNNWPYSKLIPNSGLSGRGRAAIVCFPGIFYRGGAEQKIRKYLIDKKLFNGEIHQLDDSRTVCMNVSAKLLNLEGDYTGMIAVYDSILVCWDANYKDYFLNLFHIDKGEENGYFCPKGH